MSIDAMLREFDEKRLEHRTSTGPRVAWMPPAFELPAPTVQPGWGRRLSAANAARRHFDCRSVSVTTARACAGAFDHPQAKHGLRECWRPDYATSTPAVAVAAPEYTHTQYRNELAAAVAVAAPLPASEWCCGGTCLRKICEWHSPEAIAKAAAKDAAAAPQTAQLWCVEFYNEGGWRRSHRVDAKQHVFVTELEAAIEAERCERASIELTYRAAPIGDAG